MTERDRVGTASALKALKARVTPAERAALRDGGAGLVISRYNRETLLRMLDMDAPPAGRDVDARGMAALEAALEDYLARYMPDRPEGHKWIVISCLFLACIVREPMHPREIVGWEEADGGYLCPARDTSPGSLCRWCACRAAT